MTENKASIDDLITENIELGLVIDTKDFYIERLKQDREILIKFVKMLMRKVKENAK